MQSPKPIAIDDLLLALSSECAALSVISERVQTIVVCAGRTRPMGESFYSHAQACDLLTQTLMAITQFLAAVAQRVPHAWTVDIADALEGVPLSDLAAALALAPRPSLETAGGAIELFD